MSPGTRPASNRERGAVLIHVAFALLALLAFTTFVVDYGVLWVARRQAQNSADAGALAGAIAAAYDDSSDLTDSGPAKQNAYAATQNNIVFGQPPSVVISSDITFPTCPDGNGRCIRVDTYRTVARGNPLPMFFGQLIGLDNQDVRAMAMAQIVPGNTSECLKPWAVPDKWQEFDGTDWDPTDTFDRYDRDFNVIPTPDEYIPPTENDTGTGFNLQEDLNRELVLKVGNPQDAIRPGWFFPVALAANPGGAEYRDAIGGCVGIPYSIGDFLPVEPGNMIGPTKQGIEDLIAKDPNAYWDGDGVSGSCAPTCDVMSPRIVAIPIFNPDVYYQGKTGGRIDIQVVNILGFFIDRMSGNDVVGHLMTHPALYTAGRGTVGDESAFSKTIMLIR